MWKDIPGFEGRYLISDRGLVKRAARVTDTTPPRKLKERPTALTVNEYGYHAVMLLTPSGRKVCRLVHRLVMLAFVGPSDLGVNHKNGVRTDNRLENLEYATAAENARHKVNVLGTGRGSRLALAKLHEAQVLEIKQRLANGEEPPVIAASYGVDRCTIADIRAGRTWAWLQ